MCLGGERDEPLVREVTRIFSAAGRKPLVSARGAKKRRKDQGVTVSTSVDNLRHDVWAAQKASGRFCGDDSDSEGSVYLGSGSLSAPVVEKFDFASARKQRRADATQGLNDARVDAALAKVLADGCVASVPLFQQDLRNSG